MIKKWMPLLLLACGGPRFSWPEFRLAQTPAEALGQNALLLSASAFRSSQR